MKRDNWSELAVLFAIVALPVAFFLTQWGDLQTRGIFKEQVPNVQYDDYVPPNDYWGTQIRVLSDKLLSAGPDKEFFTDDDLTRSF